MKTNNKTMKQKIVEKTLLFFIVIISMILVYRVATNAIFIIGADAIFKDSQKCEIFKYVYINEMKKGIKGDTTAIIEKARYESCSK